MKKSKLTGGFTLIELQVTIVILLLIVGVVMGSLQLAGKSSKSAENLNNQSSELRIITTFLRQQINSILPLSFQYNAENRFAFKGISTGFYYVGFLPEHVVKGGPWLIHIHQQQDKLLLDYRVIDHSLSFEENIRAQFQTKVLLDGMTQFDVTYFESESGRWRNEWSEQEAIPNMVSIELSQNEIAWPILTVAIKSHSDRLASHIIKVE